MSKEQENARSLAAAVTSDLECGGLTEEALIASLAEVRGLVIGCHGRLGSPLSREDLEEAIQETSIVAWEQRKRFRAGSTVETWLYGIARLRILKLLERRRRGRAASLESIPLGDEPEAGGRRVESLFDTGLERSIRGALASCGTTAENIVRAHNLEGRSFVEIAEDLRMKESTVKSRYYRSLPSLRSLLGHFWRG